MMRSLWLLAATMIATPVAASVLPPIEVELTLGQPVPAGDGYDLAGVVVADVPVATDSGDVASLRIRLVVKDGEARVAPEEMTIDAPPIGHPIRRDVQVHVTALADVEVTAYAETYDAAGDKMWSRADSAFVLATGDDVRVGRSSAADLVREHLHAAVARGAMTPDGATAAEAALLRGLRPLPGTVTFTPRGAEVVTPHAVVATTDVSGNAKYVVRNGTTAAGPYRNIVGAQVQFVDRQPGGDVVIGSTTTTDSSGNYSAAGVPGQRVDSSAVNLVVQVLSFSTPAKVGPKGQRVNVYVAESAPQVVGSATTSANVIAGPEAPTAQMAFSIFDAITVAHDFLQTFDSQTGVGNNPDGTPLVFIEYPGDNANGSFFSQSGDAHLNIGQNHAFDWDVLTHEYGHYVQFLNGTSVGVGGQHFITGNNTGNNCLATSGGVCTTARASALTKDQGDKLAWGEGWPTFFGTNLQIAVGAASFGVPKAGDTRYDDTANAFGYDLEGNTSLARGNGEDNELAVQRTLWDLADTPMDESDEITFGTAAMWSNTIGGTKPITLSQFWGVINGLVPPSAGFYSTGNATENLIKYGAISGDHGVGPLASAPVDNAPVDASTPPTFKWKTQGAGGSPNPIGIYGPSYHLNKFKVKFYDEKFQTLIFTSPEIVKNGTTDTDGEYTPSLADWQTILAGADLVKWTVEGTSDSPAPTTGPYHSKARTLNGVNIAFVIDDTGSMGDEIDGVKQALTDFITQLGALDPPQHPLIEVVSFEDQVNKLIISSDLTAIQNVVNGLSAGGGNDCPESSAEALLAASKDVVGSFASASGRKGKILFATDASPHAGYSLAGIESTIQSKGIDIVELVTGDCVGFLSSPAGPFATPRSPDADHVCAAASNRKTGTCEAIVPDVECMPCAVGGGGGPADASNFATSGDGPTPSTTQAFPEIAAAVNGIVAFHPEAKSGDLTALESILTNSALGAVIPRVFHANPDMVPDGSTVNVAITGGNTNWGAGTTLAVSGDGVTVNSVTVQSPTSLLANLSISADATQSARDVTATTPLGDSNEVAMGTNVIVVGAAAAFPTVTSVQPSTVAQGSTVDIAITGASTTFANGSSTVDFSDGSVTVNSVTVSSGTLLTANITVGDDASLGLHNVSVTTGSEQATEFVPGPLTVVSSAAALGGGPSIASISPTLGALGQTLDVAIVGQNTSFADGVSTASFSGSGITVQSTQVTDATHASAHIVIANDAGLGFRDVSVETGPEQATLRTGFQVLATPPEVCGNCTDDDGDGMVDYEDSDCCSAPASMTIKAFKFKVSKTGKPSPLTIGISVPMAGIDPTSSDVELQLSNGNGEAFCALLTHGGWSKKKKSFKFSDKTGAAGGLSIGVLNFKKKGAIANLVLTGKRIDLSRFTDPSYTATLRIGSQCATGSKRKGH